MGEHILLRCVKVGKAERKVLISRKLPKPFLLLLNNLLLHVLVCKTTTKISIIVCDCGKMRQRSSSVNCFFVFCFFLVKLLLFALQHKMKIKFWLSNNICCKEFVVEAHQQPSCPYGQHIYYYNNQAASLFKNSIFPGKTDKKQSAGNSSTDG